MKLSSWEQVYTCVNASRCVSLFNIGLTLTHAGAVIARSEYAGETKKAVLSFMMLKLPRRGILVLHGSAVVGNNGKSCIFLGLSGTGKTTLSAAPGFELVGDDEIAWAPTGLYNIEGGCYAKVCAHARARVCMCLEIHMSVSASVYLSHALCLEQTDCLTAQSEPEIYAALRFGAVCENVALDPTTRVLHLDDTRLTKNGRASYPLSHIRTARMPSHAAAPTNLVFLICDGFGLFPAVSRLSLPQAIYHFLSGYTSRYEG